MTVKFVRLVSRTARLSVQVLPEPRKLVTLFTLRDEFKHPEPVRSLLSTSTLLPFIIPIPEPRSLTFTFRIVRSELLVVLMACVLPNTHATGLDKSTFSTSELLTLVSTSAT